MAKQEIRARCFLRGLDNIELARWPRQWWKDLKRFAGDPLIKAEFSVTPDVAKACEPNTWLIRYTVKDVPLEEGSHIAIEIPNTWKADLGNFFPLATKDLRVIEDYRPGYGSFVSVRPSNPNIETDVAVSYSPYMHLIDIAICKGRLLPGDSLEITLGDPSGSKLRAQKHAQKAVLYVAVDVKGDGRYRPVVRHPVVKIIGAHPTALKVIGPSVIKKGEPFYLTVMATDPYNQNPASFYTGKVTLATSQLGLRTPENIVFASKEKAIERVGPCIAEKEGTYHVVACDLEQGLAGRSNPISTNFEANKRIYFGEIHAHNELSLGTGDMDEYFQWGRDVECLDFCSTGIHTAGNYRYGDTEYIWQKIVEATNRYYEPGKFVTLLGYEWSGAGGGGDKCVYYKSANAPTYPGNRPNDDNPKNLWKCLQGKEAITIPHHTKYGGVTDWSFRNDQFQRLVEISSGWGISESGGEHSVQRALAMGHRLGFTAGTDSHFGQPGHGAHGVNEGRGLVAVYADELTRKGIFDALYDRFCYATTGERILLDFKVNGHRMGEEVLVSEDSLSFKQRDVQIKVIGTAKIKKIEIIRNNQVISACEPDGEIGQYEWQDEEVLQDILISPAFTGDRPFVFYYCRVTQESRDIAWSSPIWFILE